MKFSAGQIAQFLGGRVEGDPEVSVSTVSKIEEGKVGSLAFLANPKYGKYLYETEASIVLINDDLEITCEVKPTLIRVPNAYESFASLLEMVSQTRPQKVGVDMQAYVSPSAVLGENVYVGTFAFVGESVTIGNNVKIYPQVYIGDNVTIGDNTILNPGVKIYADCMIGKNCIVHAGTVIGSDGFGFAPQSGSDYKKIHHIGNVVIEDNVEVGANTTIDRATMGSTFIRAGVKLDNLIQVAHNVEIGERTVIAALTGISGSTKIGKDCMVGGQVGFAGHLSVIDGTKIGAQSGILSNVRKEDSILIGSPSMPMQDYMKSYIYFKKLPSLVTRIEQLEAQLKAKE